MKVASVPRFVTALACAVGIAVAHGDDRSESPLQITLMAKGGQQNRSHRETTGELEFRIVARQPILPGQQGGICVKQGGLTAAEERRLAVYAKTRGYLVWQRRNGRTKAWLEADRKRGLHETGGARQVTCGQRREVGASESWTVPHHTWNEVSWDERRKTISLVGRVMVKEEVPWKTRYAVRHEYHIRWNVREGRVYASYDRNGFRDFDLWIRTPGYLWQQVIRRRGHAKQHLYTTLEGRGSGPVGGAEVGDGRMPGGGWETETTPAELHLARTRQYNQRPPSTITQVARIAGNLAGAYVKETYLVPEMQPEETDFESVLEPDERWREPAGGEEVADRAEERPPETNSTTPYREETRNSLSKLLTDALEYEWSDPRWYPWYKNVRALPNVTEEEVVRYAKALDIRRRHDWLMAREAIPTAVPQQGPVMRAAPLSVPVSDVWNDVQVSLVAQFASWINDGVPYASFAKTAIEIKTGRDPWTRQQIDPAMQWMALGLSALPAGKIAFRATRLAIKREGKLLPGTAKGLAKAIDQIRRDEGLKGLKKSIYIFTEVWDGTGAGRMKMEYRAPPPDGVPLHDTSTGLQLKTLPFVPADTKGR